MTEALSSQSSPPDQEPEFERNEGGCARLFLTLLAIVSPLLAICISIVYRTIGYRTMANRLLWLSIIILGLQLIAFVSVWVSLGHTVNSIMDNFS